MEQHFWHWGTVARVPFGEHELIVSLFADDDDDDPIVRLQSRLTQDDDAARKPLLSMTTSRACQLTAALLEAVDKTRTAADRVGDDGASWDLDLLAAFFRDQAEQERARHGPELRMGPFDDLPVGLMALVSHDFTIRADPQRALDWLLGMLHDRRVETGRTDEEIAQEIVELLGADAAQVIGGWLYRAEPHR